MKDDKGLRASDSGHVYAVEWLPFRATVPVRQWVKTEQEATWISDEAVRLGGIRPRIFRYDTTNEQEIK
jgi:hypothetical protein